jgi:Flp pilus assembly secretin CpaC
MAPVCRFGVLLLAFALFASRFAAAETRSILVGTHERLLLPKDATRVSVGNPEIVSIELLTSRELLLLGRRVGRTNALVWLGDGSVLEIQLRADRDLSLLREALQDIDPAIRVELAPDRDAVVLLGTVPDVGYSRAAEATARAFLQNGDDVVVAERAAQVTPPEGAAEGEPASQPAYAAASLDGEGRRSGDRNVINLIRVTSLPAPLEERLLEVIGSLAGPGISVRRVRAGDLADDFLDTFVLEGSAPNQIALVRALLAASQLVTGRSGDTREIRVLANEAGSLPGGGLGGGGSGANGGGGASIVGAIGQLSGGGVGGGGVGGNRIGSNVARATALAAGGGRILSFVEVVDLPQVRIEARIYEVNRTRLLNWEPNVAVLIADFDQPPLLPGALATLLQGENAPSVGEGGESQFGAALGALAGALLSQFQVVSGYFALDAAFTLLEREGIARSLSKPSLTVLSGETADFRAGGQIPITVTLDTGGVNSPELIGQTVVFADFGVSLAVRPLVGEDDVITLDVTPNITTPDFALTAALRAATGETQASTAFETRSLQTTTRLRDGQALIVGGLHSGSISEESSFTPGISRVPGFGWLTKTLDDQADDLEVVIVVSPTLVRQPEPRLALWEFARADELLAR